MTAQQVIMLALQASIMVTVFGFGLQATPGDVLYLVRQPSLLIRSIFSMFVVMPFVAIVLDSVFTLRPPVEIALIALAISPVPPLLPGREGKAGGHGSYGLGLMAIAGLLSIVTVPVTLALLGKYLGRDFGMSAGEIAGVVFKMALLPLAAGLACRAILPSLAARVAKPLILIAKLLLALGVLAILIHAMPQVIEELGDGTLAVLVAIAVVGLAVGHWLGGPRRDERLVLALSTASRHPAIALAIAKVNFPEQHVGATILLYLLVSLVVGLPYQARMKRALKGADAG